MKKNYDVFTALVAIAILCCLPFQASAAKPKEKKSHPVVIAYVTSWSHILPDPEVVTHVNYAFGHVTESFNGIGIANEERLRAVVAVKRQKTSHNSQNRPCS